MAIFSKTLLKLYFYNSSRIALFLDVLFTLRHVRKNDISSQIQGKTWQVTDIQMVILKVKKFSKNLLPWKDEYSKSYLSLQVWSTCWRVQRRPGQDVCWSPCRASWSHGRPDSVYLYQRVWGTDVHETHDPNKAHSEDFTQRFESVEHSEKGLKKHWTTSWVIRRHFQRVKVTNIEDDELTMCARQNKDWNYTWIC